MKRISIITKLLPILFLLSVFLFTGCPENITTRKFGGKMEVKINGREKFVNITWKDNDLWIVTRPRKVGEEPEKYWFYEKSAGGLNQGEITIIEQPTEVKK